MTADGPLSTTHLPRPDPARGVFETLLVVDGRPIELDAHLDRLATSVRELFGAPTMARVAGPARVLVETRAGELAQPSSASASPQREAAPTGPAEPGRHASLARLRLTLAPDDHGKLDLAVATADVDPATVFPGGNRGPRLTPVTITGGLGAHKWADRRLLDQAVAALDGALPLIVDADGSALEAERANVFIVSDGVLATPADDGRILPGVARARVLEIARDLEIDVAERPLALTDLDNADELFLSGSVRGVEPVRTGPTSARIADALRRHWLA